VSTSVTFAPISSLSAACLGLVALAVARDAGGSASARLVYTRGPEAASCPDEATLRNAVAARLGYDPFYPLANQTVLIQVWRDSRRYRARLQLVDQESLTHGTRDLASDEPTCAGLFAAAALAISIAMDSLSKDEGPPAPAPESVRAPESVSPPESTPAAESAPASDSAPAARSEAPLASESAPATTPGPGFAIGVDALGVVGVEPGPTGALAAFGGLHSRAASASIEVRADAPAAARSAVGPGRVRAWSYQVALVSCVHLGDASLCAVGAVGILYGESTGITNPNSDSGPFGSAGVRVGYDWPLAGRFSLRTHVDAMVDLDRARLQIGGADAWTAPVVAASGGAGIAVHF
jgi:hypothetical protein